MLELIKAGGLLMWPILACSAISVAIITERFWTLRQERVAPKDLVVQVLQWRKSGHLTHGRIKSLHENSKLGEVLVAGLNNRSAEREMMKESIEEAGRHVAHSLERFLNTLGTIASISPLLGLLGTVIGMIKVFAVITAQGVGDASVLAEGISEALLTTAAGLSVAIPTLMFHRYFTGKVNDLVVTMELEALKMVEVLQGLRESEYVNQGGPQSASQDEPVIPELL